MFGLMRPGGREIGGTATIHDCQATTRFRTPLLAGVEPECRHGATYVHSPAKINRLRNFHPLRRKASYLKSAPPRRRATPPPVASLLPLPAPRARPFAAPRRIPTTRTRSASRRATSTPSTPCPVFRFALRPPPPRHSPVPIEADRLPQPRSRGGCLRTFTGAARLVRLSTFATGSPPDPITATPPPRYPQPDRPNTSHRSSRLAVHAPPHPAFRLHSPPLPPILRPQTAVLRCCDSAIAR